MSPFLPPPTQITRFHNSSNYDRQARGKAVNPARSASRGLETEEASSLVVAVVTFGYLYFELSNLFPPPLQFLKSHFGNTLRHGPA